MLELADAKTAATKAPRKFKAKGGGISAPAKLAEAIAEVRELEEDGPPVRLIFPCPKALAAQIDEEWRKRKLMSRSATIRVLLAEALK